MRKAIPAGLSRFKTAVVLLVITTALSSCQMLQVLDRNKVPVPAEIREAAFREAETYIGMPYEWGGQDYPLKGVDCSGLIVNVYHTAVAGTGMTLLFYDAGAIHLQSRYSTMVINPQRGDLIFFGDPGTHEINHVGLVDYIADGVIHYIDSTNNPDYPTQGVDRRSIALGSEYVKSFGRMLVYN